MIGLDTNVVVRYLVQDDPPRSLKAASCIGRLTESRPGFISLVVIAETAWVLRSIYGFTDAVIADAIERLLQASELVIQDEQQVFSALTALKQGRGSFTDALIGALGSQAGCDHTLTFDRKATRLPEFELL
jgi:predicted nucleic-acid-binding protein